MLKVAIKPGVLTAYAYKDQISLQQAPPPGFPGEGYSYVVLDDVAARALLKLLLDRYGVPR